MAYSNNLFYTNLRFFYFNYYFNTKFVHLNQLDMNIFSFEYFFIVNLGQMHWSETSTYMKYTNPREVRLDGLTEYDEQAT